MNVDMNIAPMGMGSAPGPIDATPASSAAGGKAALTVTTSGKPVLDAASEIFEVSEANLDRNDSLGKLISSAFSFSAPPLPDLPQLD